MTVVTTIGADPARIDIEVVAGEPVDFTVPVGDANGDAQDLTGWTLAAPIRATPDTPILASLTLTESAGSVRVTATGDDTAAWAGWRVPVARWALWLTPPASPPYPFAAGWVRVHTIPAP